MCYDWATMTSLVGFLLAVGAFLFWGFTPAYWRLIPQVPALEILSYRIVFGFVFAWLTLLVRRQGIREVLRDTRTTASVVAASILVGINWFVYILAVSTGRILDAGLGYYINPLVSVLLGVIVLRERLTRLQIVALILATAGVLFLTFAYGRFPWISLTLAASFGTYGLLKKKMGIGGPVTMAAELTVLLPVGLVLVVVSLAGGTARFGDSPDTAAVLVGAGAVTVLPLLLFTEAARRLDLSGVGFVQYIAPTTMLLLGTLAFGEPFPVDRAVGFSFVWAALALYTVSVLISARRAGKTRRAGKAPRAGKTPRGARGGSVRPSSRGD